MRGKLLSAGAGFAALVGGLAIGVPAPAWAAQSLENVTCNGVPISIRVNNNNSNNNWSTVQVVEGGSGHLIPTSFTFSAYDTTIGQHLFTSTTEKGNGKANQNQDTVACTLEETGVLSEFAEPGTLLPPGASLTDMVTITITVTVVPKP